MKSQCKTRSAVAKQSITRVAVAISAVKVVEKKKNRKRKASPLLAVETPAIPTSQSREVESEEEEDEATAEPSVMKDRSARRSESPTAKRQRELVQKMLEDALRRGLEAQ
jgi:hypothetical protein